MYTKENYGVQFEFKSLEVFAKINSNKKVLLRKRKRHTDRSVSSTPYMLSYLGEEVGTLGYPIPPIPDLDRGRRYLGVGTPSTCEQTENITFPHPSDVVGNKHQRFQNLCICGI